MVRVRAENGSYYHEPPYTEAEEFELYRLAGNAKSLRTFRSPAAAPTSHPQKSPPEPEAK
jgi:hypothetical protein